MIYVKMATIMLALFFYTAGFVVYRDAKKDKTILMLAVSIFFLLARITLQTVEAYYGL